MLLKRWTRFFELSRLNEMLQY